MTIAITAAITAIVTLVVVSAYFASVVAERDNRILQYRRRIRCLQNDVREEQAADYYDWLETVYGDEIALHRPDARRATGGNE